MAAESETTSMDWQLDSSLIECTEHLYTNEHMSDVTIVLTSVHPPRRVPAHRFLLAIRSPVFEAMFYGLLGTTEREVTISDLPVDGFLTFLRYMYTDVAGIHGDNVMECLKMGHMYRVLCFVKECETFLMRSIDEIDVMYILQTSLLFELTMLKARCLLYIAINASSILQHESFLSISNDMLAIIIQSSDLQTSELDIYRAVHRWAERKCEHEGVLPSRQNKRQYLGNMFSFLRLGHIPASDMARVLATESLLSKYEIVMLFRLHHDDTVSELDFVENENRDGTDVCFKPVTVVERDTHFPTHVLKSDSFYVTLGANFVGLSTNCKLGRSINLPGNHFISLFLFSYRHARIHPRDFNAYEHVAVYHLENSLLEYNSGETATEFDILFDSPILLQQCKRYKLCLLIMPFTGRFVGTGRPPTTWRLVPKDKQPLNKINSYVHHELKSAKGTEQDDIITELLTM